MREDDYATRSRTTPGYGPAWIAQNIAIFCSIKWVFRLVLHTFLYIIVLNDTYIRMYVIVYIHAYLCIINFLVKPFIIEDTFIHCITVLAPESFTIFVEFVAICMDTSITWELNGNQIVDGVNVKISNDNLGNSWYKTSLTVLKSSESDSGTYTVTITSATGSDSVAITVQIISKLLQLFYLLCCFTVWQKILWGKILSN